MAARPPASKMSGDERDTHGQGPCRRRCRPPSFFRPRLGDCPRRDHRPGRCQRRGQVHPAAHPGRAGPTGSGRSRAQPAATVGYLSQEPERRPGESINGFIARRTGVARAQQDLDEATALLVEEKPGADDAYATALERWLALGGADLEERAAAVFTTLGLPVDAGSEAMTSLSGGQAARVNLASLLLSRYYVFLLDQPTNDLDIAGLEILEGFVRACGPEPCWSATTARFSSAPCTGFLELDLAQQQVCLYGGGYLAYLGERQIAREHAREAYEKYADTRVNLRNGCGPRSAGPTRASVKPGPRRPTTTSTSCTGRSPVRKSWRARSRPQSGCWTAWTSSPSRARSGSSRNGDRRRAPVRYGGRHAARRGPRTRRLPPRPSQPPGQLGRPDRHHWPERGRQVDPHRSATWSASAGIGSRIPGQRHSGRRGGPGPQPVRRRGSAAGGVRGAGPEPAPRGHQDTAGQVRTGGRPCAAPSELAVAGRADPGGPGAAPGPGA